jgi:DNA polymerase-3 subunit epsilon
MFINAFLYQQGFDTMSNRVLDTATVFRWAFQLNKIPPLEDLIDHYQVRMDNRHSALGDAGMTAKVWQKLLVDVKKRGVDTLGDLVDALTNYSPN